MGLDPMVHVALADGLAFPRREERSPRHVKGDVPGVHTAVETEVRRILDERGLSIPVNPGEMLREARTSRGGSPLYSVGARISLRASAANC